MVKMREAEPEARLEALLRRLCEAHGFTLFIEGWTRKTYDVYYREGRLGHNEHMARLETLVIHNGEVHFFDDRAETFAQELGTALEEEFGIEEAVLVRDRAPNAY